MTKVELRRQFLARRRALPTDDADRYSQRIAACFFEFLEKIAYTEQRPNLHTFLPIRKQNGVNTWLIIHRIWAEFSRINVIAPVTDLSKGTMMHYLLSPQTPLVENRLGIPEPAITGAKPQSSSHLDMVLVPLLAFDQRGYRVGYGGGFYDRFLAECRPDCLKIGLSLFDSVGAIDDVEYTDIRLNLCITPEKVYFFD